MLNFDQDAESASCQVDASYWIAVIFDTHCTSGVVVQHMKYGSPRNGTRAAGSESQAAASSPKLLVKSPRQQNLGPPGLFHPPPQTQND